MFMQLNVHHAMNLLFQVLVLGCGLRPEPLSDDLAQYLSKRGIKVEVLDSVRLTGQVLRLQINLAFSAQRNATGYFNVLNEEGRVVVGALLAADPDSPLPETMPAFKDPLWERGFALGSKSLI